MRTSMSTRTIPSATPILMPNAIKPDTSRRAICVPQTTFVGVIQRRDLLADQVVSVELIRSQVFVRQFDNVLMVGEQNHLCLVGQL